MSQTNRRPRGFLRSVALSMAFAVAAIAPAKAQAAFEPQKDVTLVISYAPGGGLDLFARLVIDIIREDKLAPVNITPENRPGGSGAVGVGWVKANRNDDNETLVALNIAGILTPLQVAGAPGWRDLRPLSNIMAEDYVVFVKGDSKVQSIADLAKLATEGGPQSVSFAVGGIGDTLAARVAGKAIGTEFNLVTFSGGGESINALLGGNVDATISNPGEFLGQLQSGAIRAVGTLRQERYEGELAAIPTLKEAGFPNALMQNWRGIAGPAGMSDEAAAYWEGVMAKVAQSPKLAAYLKQNSASLSVHAGAGYKNYIAEQETVFKGLMQ